MAGGLGGGGVRPTLRRPDVGPRSQRPGSGTRPEDWRDVERTADDRAAASAPALLTPAVWIGVIGLCLMAFDVFGGLGPGKHGPVLAEIWGPMVGIAVAYVLVLAVRRVMLARR